MTPSRESGTKSSTERKIGFPHGAFNANGRWIPEGSHDFIVDEVMKSMLWVRRHEKLSPADFLLRLAKYHRSDAALRLLGVETVGEMSNLTGINDWSLIHDNLMSDAACWLVHCGSPYADHVWRESGHWVPTTGKPVWEK